MALNGKTNVDQWFPVLLIASSDSVTPQSATSFSAVDVKYQFEGASSQSTYTPAVDNWAESGQGQYWLQIGASEFSATGLYQLSVSAASALTYRWVVDTASSVLMNGLVDDVAVNILSVDAEGNSAYITYQDSSGNLRVKRTNFENYENLNIISSASS